MDDSDRSDWLSGAFSQVLAGVILAVVVGGTAPWWWNNFFRGQSIIGTWELIKTVGAANDCGSESRIEFGSNGVFSTPKGFSTNYSVQNGLVTMEYNQYLDGPMDADFEINNGKLYLSPINPFAENRLNCTYVYERRN